nr:hypothetical protein [Pandoravirus massiliensis]
MRALGLRDPRDASALDLARWITNNKTQLDALGGPSIFGGGADPTNVKNPAECVAGAGKLEPILRSDGEDMIEIVDKLAVSLCAAHGPPSFSVVCTDLDNICSIDLDALAHVGDTDKEEIDAFRHNCWTENWFDLVRGIVACAFGSGAEVPFRVD